MLGAETTRPSSTMASCPVGQVADCELHWPAAALNSPMPSAPPRKTGFTTHSPVAASSVARAVSRAPPVRSLGPTW